jgi:lipid-binding SYLF domain-containing protein
MPPVGSDHMRSLDPCQPQRVCIPCAEMLIPYQEELRSSVAKAAQEVAVDPVSVQRYMNTPISFKMEDEIKKAVYTLLNFSEASDISGDLSDSAAARQDLLDGESPGEILASARGIVFMTVLKSGVLLSSKIGSGLVIGRTPDGKGWSAPSAVMVVGSGFGLQIGTEVSDSMIVIRSKEALDAFCSSAQMALGTAVGAAAGLTGRSMSATVHTQNENSIHRLEQSDAAGARAYASKASSGASHLDDIGDEVKEVLDGALSSTAYSYSRSRGLYLGASVEAGLLISRPDLNKSFYGSAITAQTLLSGRHPQPRAAAALYDALAKITTNSSSAQGHSPSPGTANAAGIVENPFAIDDEGESEEHTYSSSGRDREKDSEEPEIDLFTVHDAPANPFVEPDAEM